MYAVGEINLSSCLIMKVPMSKLGLASNRYLVIYIYIYILFALSGRLVTSEDL